MNFSTNIESAGSRRKSRSRRLNGFTLIEVMISVVLVLLLTYGIAQVFKLSSDTVDAQMAISGMVRDHRAAVNTLTEDFRNCVNDSPLFLIDSQVAYDGTLETIDGKPSHRGFRAGFKTPLEETQSFDPNKDPTKFDANGQPLALKFTDYTDRTPRLDRLAFFARGLYRRQTANNSQVYSPTTSTEAYIWIGHTAYPGQSTPPIKGSAYPAGFMTIPQNQYAQDRVLGRLAILLGDRNSFQASDDYLGDGGTPTPPTSFLFPLDYHSEAFKSSRDLANTSIDFWRTNANSAFALPNGYMNWYLPMDDVTVGAPPTHQIWRAWCQPTLQRPITSAKIAQTTSCFIPHCTQFIVEYAGDYLAQDPNDLNWPGRVTDAGAKMDSTTGAVTAGVTDGEIDYVLQKDPVNTNISVKRIRWYGLPRDTNGDGKIDITDVLPLADVMDFYANVAVPPSNNLKVGGSGATYWAPWEKVLPRGGLVAMPSRDYANFPYPASDLKYICAWHNAAPAMIRISMKFDDPAGKLQDGQWYEYILTR